MNWVVRAPGGDLERAEKKLYSRVRRVLWEYEPLRASHAEIQINVDGPVVLLSGRVRTLPQKQIAQMLVERMTDVASVTNDLIADPEVVRAVADALAEDDRTAPYVLRVDARHGVVALRGEVPSPDVIQVALDIARSAPLVGSVRNELVVGEDSPPAAAVSRPAASADQLDPVRARGVRA